MANCNSRLVHTPSNLHLFLVLFIRLVVVVVIVLLLVLALLVGRLLGFLLLLLLALLNLAECLPLLSEAVGLRNVIRDDDVVKDGATLHLPKVKSKEAEVGEF